MKRPPEVLKTFPVLIEGKSYDVKLLAPHKREEMDQVMVTHPTVALWAFVALAIAAIYKTGKDWRGPS